MLAKRIRGATGRSVRGADAPAGVDIRPLAVCAVREGEAMAYESAWDPTPTELRMLVEGGHVILGILGSQPPVRLTVEPFEEMAVAEGE